MSALGDRPGRFSALLSGASRAVCDKILYEDDHVFVVPTLGSIVPYWLLVVPKVPSINFSNWADATGQNPTALTRAVQRYLAPEKPSIWFEHGASKEGTEVGCGVDYAHIHLLLDPSVLPGFRRTVESLSKVVWQPTDTRSIYPTSSGDYYAFGDFQSGFVFSGGTLGRQFFRKVVARLAGQPDQWDYRIYANTENVRRTIRRFSGPVSKAA